MASTATVEESGLTLTPPDPSITSLLNFAHVRPLGDELNPDFKDWSPAAYLLEHNRAARFLKRQGYEFVFFSSTWFPITRATRSLVPPGGNGTTIRIGPAIDTCARAGRTANGNASAVAARLRRLIMSHPPLPARGRRWGLQAQGACHGTAAVLP